MLAILDIKSTNTEHNLLIFNLHHWVFSHAHEKRLEKIYANNMKHFFNFFELNNEIYELKLKEGEGQKGNCTCLPTCSGKILMHEGIFGAG